MARGKKYQLEQVANLLRLRLKRYAEGRPGDGWPSAFISEKKILVG